MTPVGDLEIQTQQRVINHFRDQLAQTFLGNKHGREDNRNIEPDLLTRSLARQSHSSALIAKALDKLDKTAALGASRTLCDANRDL